MTSVDATSTSTVCGANEIETPDALGNETAGIDLGISNFAAVAYSTEDADLYPGNLDLHGWAFDRFTNILEYKAKVVEVSERDTSKTCCVCGRQDENQPVERGLYVCEDCAAAFNADVNGEENIRLNINDESNSESAPSLGGDRSTRWLAQPGVYLYDLSSGFQPQEQVVDCKP